VKDALSWEALGGLEMICRVNVDKVMVWMYQIDGEIGGKT